MMKISREINAALFPSVTVLFILIFSTLALNHGWKIESEGLAAWIIRSGLAFQIIFLFFGAYPVYIFSFRAGASGWIRVTASFTPVYFWFAYQAIKYLPLYTVPETLYILFNPVIMFFIIRTFFQAGISELFCRFIFRKHPVEKRISNVNTAALVIAGFAGMVVTLLFVIPFIVQYRHTFSKLFS